MITKIQEDEKIVDYLKKRSLLSQYKKIKKILLASKNIYKKLKKREPKKDGFYQFRINKQYRAYCVFSKVYPDIIIVYEINNHQN